MLNGAAPFLIGQGAQLTTSVKVQSHNYPVLVRLIDSTRTEYPNASKAGKPVSLYSEAVTVTEQVLWPEDGEQWFHCTTSRRMECIDLDYNDPRAARKPAVEQGADP